MSSKRKSILFALLFLGPISTAPLASCERTGECSPFGSCDAGCPYLVCDCDDQQVTVNETCRTDGTCNTAVDCPSVCQAAGSTCAKPATTCQQFIPTECICSGSGSAVTSTSSNFEPSTTGTGISDPSTTTTSSGDSSVGGSNGKYADVWSCSEGRQLAITDYQCALACGTKLASGTGGNGQSSVATGNPVGEGGFGVPAANAGGHTVPYAQGGAFSGVGGI